MHNTVQKPDNTATANAVISLASEVEHLERKLNVIKNKLVRTEFENKLLTKKLSHSKKHSNLNKRLSAQYLLEVCEALIPKR